MPLLTHTPRHLAYSQEASRLLSTPAADPCRPNGVTTAKASAGTVPVRPHCRHRLRAALGLALPVALSAFLVAPKAEAVGCRVDSRNYGPGVLGAYLCHGIALLDGLSCIRFPNGDYHVVRGVICDVIAEVMVYEDDV